MEIQRCCAAVLAAFLSCISLAICVENGDVRLQDGHNSAEGRVEVYQNGAWGTVCDDGFDINDARVVCRQLGFSSANESHCCAHFTHGTGAIYIDDLACSGTEARISDCPHRGWGEHNCAHTEDASVTCNGNIRLQGSNSSIEGRVEIYKDSNWGSVCDSGWDLPDGDVVCKQLGYPGANATFGESKYGKATGPVVVSNVECTANDTEFFNCTLNMEPGPECANHTRDASVRCKRPVKLMGGRNPLEGYVAVYDGTNWGPICAKNWDINDARVICKQIGDMAAIEATVGMRFGQTTASYMMSNVECSGMEGALDQCRSTDTGNVDCVRYIRSDTDAKLLNETNDLAGVRCAPAVRLVSDGSAFLQGKVEVFVNGQWGGVCSDQWDRSDAEVVCRQLGEYPPANLSCCEPSVDMIQSPLMTNLMCTGSEARLQDCPVASGQAPQTCRSATVKCQVSVRLYGGQHSLEGNVEISRGGEWGGICDDNWGLEDAKVVCRQLGNYEVVSHSCCSKYSPPTNSYLLDDVGCNGDEARVEDCYHSDWGTHNCGTSEAAGVSCRNFRLVSDDLNTDSPKGRVEVVHNGRWGRVCGDEWDIKDATVLCRQLYNSTAEQIGSFQSGTGLAFMTNFQCNGSEGSLLECPFEEREISGCTADATVICRGGLRLVGGRTPLEGRVEIFHDGQWGTICDDGWDINDAQVVCNQLGNYAALAAKCCQAYGPGTGPILMDGVNCIGNEKTLESCPHEGWQSHNCQHYEDASAVCTDLKLTSDNGTASTGALEGRVEILLDGTWQSICPFGWDKRAAQVVCTQLYNTDVKNVTYYSPLPGQDTGMTSIQCSGNEKLLTDCTSSTTNVICPSKYRAGVQCKDIRLVGSKQPSEGAVETLVEGEWGLICGNDWGMQEGAVACRQLGYCKPVSVQRGWEPPIEERTLMHWHSLNCTGGEERLRDCPKSRGSFPCSGYNFEAAVTCKNWCDPPAYFLHGSWAPRRTQYTLRSKIAFTCDDGYELQGSRIMECLDVCEWNAGIPTCIESAKKPDGGSSNTGEETSPPASGIHPAGIFFIGLIVGIVIVVIIYGFIWFIKRKPSNGHRGSPSRAGNIFRPRKKHDEMEEPVLSFQSMSLEHDDENGDAM